ncbi:twin-arginine translocation signal domain-containing protein [Lutibaculum baratangense]|uniref:Formate dehydrogenase subunit or accessory protein n=1 Tax=Lutibaculum baratangense AMV1 TaxID=631454 RepID=V4QXV4_9HYPH|nr:twin-arginine translocation signal domain-containing protein [Lutibaculum baratangense]ESR24582.1 hypothetical protein N177_2416 [Lutibaculum baratangense AMV1]
MAEKRSDGGRRDFLKLATLGTAAGAVIAASGDAVAEDARDAAAAADYRETEHVRTFYRLARF